MPSAADEMGLTHRERQAESADEADLDDRLLRESDPYESGKRRPLKYRNIAVCVVVVVALTFVGHGMLREWKDASILRAATWNVAAINNNPFEYWITHEDADYNKLMEDVQEFINAPGARDVAVSSVFTPAMWTELKALMAARSWAGLDQVERFWLEDYSQRKVISGFMKDKALGEKRLASMPDRVTNTINLAGGGVANRPTVINCFSGSMGSVELWWKEWKAFMFEKPVQLPGKSTVEGPVATLPASMLGKIKKSKYPAITTEEEAISIPLQTLAQAIFDAILVHIVNSVSPHAKWQTLQQQMCDSLNRRKDERTLSILSAAYSDTDLFFLQETASVFVRKAEAHERLSSGYFVAKSATLDAKRDQNSVMLLSRSYFREQTLAEHTNAVMSAFDKSVPVANGDLLVVAVQDILDRRYLLASFHGDTNGLATLPVLDAVHKFALTMPDHRLVFGLDANTYEIGSSSKQGVAEFASAFVAAGYSSCWGDSPNPQSPTTFNARTYLQPQLQKAARTDEKVSKGDKNPKDFILFPKKGFAVQKATKDNTGKRSYIEDMVFPTLHFPSDHGLVWTTLQVT